MVVAANSGFGIQKVLFIRLTIDFVAKKVLVLPKISTTLAQEIKNIFSRNFLEINHIRVSFNRLVGFRRRLMFFPAGFQGLEPHPQLFRGSAPLPPGQDHDALAVGPSAHTAAEAESGKEVVSSML